ncbi:uncharacterized protein KY384_004897 [Bacidia gigantensis]|uniref:uncharacterized protein n=1 Tax=Bacidia gigantensis TaxID=2732470 RepID=UPI001D059226|nr:uncharacterized protein KY384_004897 [Bacidia gigantensis]KAG8530395.1 hypothetical protein KY384_004897 [Bacidia gigantensis]
MSSTLPLHPGPRPLPSPNNPVQQSTSPLPPSQSQSSSKPQQQHTGLRVPSNRKTIYDRNINRTRAAELSRASFAYIFAEMVAYAQKKVTGIQDLERRLNEQGYPLGLRLTPLRAESCHGKPVLHRLSTPTAPQPRPTRILPLLQFIANPLWRHLFNRPADAVESSATNSREYMISDNEPLVNQYISVPKEMSQLNCAAFVAGIIEGVVCGVLGGPGVGMGQALYGEGRLPTNEPPAAVSAHNAGEVNGMWPGKTVFLIRFSEDVVKREANK